MAYYNLSEIIDCLQDYAKQGIKFVEISELAPDSECDSSTLFLNGIVDDSETIEEQIDSVSYPF